MWRSYCEESTKDADHDGEEDDQKKAESGAFVASGLGVDDCQGKGSVAANDRCEVIDAVEDRDGVEERC